MKFKSLALSILSVALMGAMLTSCSKKSELASQIPAESALVIKINADKLVKNAGCTVDDGIISLSSDINSALTMEQRAAVATVLKYGEGIDLKEIYVFEADLESAEAFALLAGMTKPEKVADNLKSIADAPENSNGYEVYNLGHNGIAAIKGNQLWIAENLDNILALNKAAEDSSINDVKGINEWVGEDDAFVVACNLAKIDDVSSMLPSQYLKYWALAKLDFEGGKMDGEFCLMDKDGKRDNFGEAFGKVDTDFLAYTPEGTNCVIALGNIESKTLRQLMTMGAMQLGNMGYVINDLDGTIAMAMDVTKLADNPELLESLENNPAVVLSQVKLALYAHYPEATLSKIVNLVNSFLGGTPTADNKDIYHASFSGIDLYYGNADGYLVAANAPVEKHAPVFKSYFNDARAAICSENGPSAFSKKFGADYGSKGYITVDEDEVEFKAELTGTNLNYLEAVAKMFCNQNFQQYLQGMMRQFGRSFKTASACDADDFYCEEVEWDDTDWE